MSIRNNLHTETGLATYAQGMCNSSNDKAKINAHLVPGTILELGCGNGAYLQTLPEHLLRQTTALDMNALLLLKAQENLADKAGLVVFKRTNMLQSNLIEIFETKFDNIVLCSVLHELYSESRTASIAEGSCAARADNHARLVVFAFIENALKLLNVGGRLIIRDGCRPESKKFTLGFKTPQVRHDFARFVDDHPWFINYSEQNGKVTLNLPDAFEFMTKYFYTENWDVEVLERFGWSNNIELIDAIKRRKPHMKVVHSSSYLIPWLNEKWNNDFSSTEPFPDSTMIVALEKTQ